MTAQLFAATGFRKFVDAYDAGRHKDYLKKVIIKSVSFIVLNVMRQNDYTIEQRLISAENKSFCS